MSWRAIAGFRLVTQAPERAAGFYAALGFAIDAVVPIDAADCALLGVSGGTRRRMRRGGVIVDLDCYAEAGVTYPSATADNSTLFQHLALVSDDIAEEWARAERAGAVAISRDGPVTLPASSGGVTAVKFRDPDGHPLELIHFPDRADHPAIDHSAISVGDVAASIAFYAGQGLTTGARTLNVGPAQDALDGLEGAEVDVVPLLPEVPAPHLELLGYRRPAATAPPPPAVTDVVATRIVWRAGQVGLVRDPDGHLHELVAN